MSEHLLLTKYDISPIWHEKYPGIMHRFVENFPEPVIVGGQCIGAGPIGRPTVGYIVSIEERGEDLWGDIHWTGDQPPVDMHVRMNWSSGPGQERVSLTSGYLDRWPHLTAWEDEAGDGIERGLRLGEDGTDGEET